MSAAQLDTDTPDYIVVGSGAGGGTVAARLAEAGYTVTVLEAGGDPNADAANNLPEQYEVPAFHALSSENPSQKWDFFVHHYDDKTQELKDDKFVAAENGVLYPRAGALGGCTVHNAMILVYPANEDWDAIATLTGDQSWSADHMRQYFERLENCHHRPVLRALGTVEMNPARHGWHGWLHAEKAIPEAALKDKSLVETIVESVVSAFAHVGMPVPQVDELLEGGGDPNDWRVVQQNGEGLRYTPLATRNHHRMGTRERLLETAQKLPDKLKIVTNALVTKVILDDNQRAIGVEYLKGAKLYRASAAPSPVAGERRAIHCTHEVILSGGAFNTPQILMLSGIGAPDSLEPHGIPVRVNLPGIGRNLQDRYEVGVVNRMNFPEWDILKGADFKKGDPVYQQWENGQGCYITNGAVLAVIKKSLAQRPIPDLFLFALLGLFRGYYPGYSKILAEKHNYLTWAILKAHTVNRGGLVRLTSADPRDPPDIRFRYFEEGTDAAGEDLDFVVAAIRFVRELTKDLKADGQIAEEELPGDALQTDGDLKDFVRNNAWGHHASCTCPIGPPDLGGVLSSDFRVHGTQGLRVVDASVFPRIPGYFIVSAVYMIGEKAADVIAASRP